jgi:hypothetical protein
MASASIAWVDKYVPDASLVGKARFKFIFWDVFDASLYAPAGRYDPSKPFVLALTYRRKISSEEIVDASLSEIRKQGPIDVSLTDEWKAQLAAFIPDVDNATTLSGVRTIEGHTRFYDNDTFVGVIDDRRFTTRFFGIWLGESTSYPLVRDQLLNKTSS